MTEPWVLELEPEVQDWLELLPFRLYRRVEDKADRLLGETTTLGEPYSRHLGGKLRDSASRWTRRPCASRTGSRPVSGSCC
jgi:hypothetical protein